VMLRPHIRLAWFSENALRWHPQRRWAGLPTNLRQYVLQNRSCQAQYRQNTDYCCTHLLNERVLPFYEEHEIPVLGVLTDRGTEYCGKPQHHNYLLYLALNEIQHTRTKTRSPQTNGIVERFHKTTLNKF